MNKELLTPENIEYIQRARHIAETVMRPVAAKVRNFAKEIISS